VKPFGSTAAYQSALLNFIAEQSRQGSGDLNDRAAKIGGLLRQFVRLRIPVELPEDVQIGLASIIGAWAVHRTQVRHQFMMGRNVVVSDDLLEKIWDKAEAMDHGRDDSVHAFEVYPILARRWPERKAELLDRLWRALVSDEEDEVRAAVGGLYSWVDEQATSTQEADADLDDRVREVGIGIATRRCGA